MHTDMMNFVKKYLQPLTMHYDMGWQCHSSGSAYNSMSRHAFLVGTNSNKILKCIVFSKSCCTCSRRGKKGMNPESMEKNNNVMGIHSTEDKDHRCPWNFKGSSKLMEPWGAVTLITDLFDTWIAFAVELVVDDDCSMKANMQHSFADLVKEKYGLTKKHAGQGRTDAM